MYKKEIELRYSDSDQMGVVYHGNYFSFFETSRTNLLRSYGIDYYDIEKSGYMFPVRDVSCTYLKSIRLGEKVFVATKMIKMSKVKMEFEHQIVDEHGDVKARGYSSIICVRKDDFKICKMDAVLPEVYKLHEQIV